MKSVVKSFFWKGKKSEKIIFPERRHFRENVCLQPNSATSFQKKFKHIVETTFIPSDGQISTVGKTCGKI